MADGVHGVGSIHGVDGCMSVCSAGCICAGVAWHGCGLLGSACEGYVGMRCSCNVDGVQYCRGRRQLMGCMGGGVHIIGVERCNRCMSVCSARCTCADVAWHGRSR